MFSDAELYELFIYVGYWPLTTYVICKYFLPFSRLSFCFLNGFLCCANASFFFLSQDTFNIFPLIPSLIHWLFKRMLFNFHVFVNFPVFLLLLISSLHCLVRKKLLGMISIILNLLRLFVTSCMIYPRKYSMCLEKNVYSTVVVWNVLCMSVRSIWYRVLFESLICLL